MRAEQMRAEWDPIRGGECFGRSTSNSERSDRRDRVRKSTTAFLREMFGDDSSRFRPGFHPPGSRSCVHTRLAQLVRGWPDRP
jgi:hypothetical protein